ncbi:MAG TPA: hypothetical protein VEL11_10755 [Candidatus Bathyarchaeia archaeon]|nr:hypothetical protein [Candidatus Bathyarchaeia archaeon]
MTTGFAPHKKHFRPIICGGLAHDGIGSWLILCRKVSISLVMTLSAWVRLHTKCRLCGIRPKCLTRGGSR